MPSLAELCEVYKNKDEINVSLKAIYDLPNGSTYANKSLEMSFYWSSSQDSYYGYNAWNVDFRDGNVDIKDKDRYPRVCCLAGF